MYQNPNYSAYSNARVPSYPEQQNSYQNFYGSRSEKSFDELSKSSMTTYGNRTMIETNKNFKVMIRVRPPLPRELDSTHYLPTIKVTQDNRKVTIYEYYNIEMVDPSQLSEYAESTNMFTMHSFNFDYVFDQDSSQVQVYETTAKPAVMSVLQGYNATILAYGQTGTGKTYTMEGFKYNNQDPQRGIVPRCMEEIFSYIENGSNATTTFMVRASYLQIYNEVISDLLRTERTNLHIREDKKKGVFVEGLSEWAVRSPSDIYSLIQKGASARATASTKMNDVSSRSHAVFIIIVEQMINNPGDEDEGGKEIRVGKLNLVDLAGSERVRVTGATGKRLEECKKINQSLSALGNVISALTDHRQPKSHIPYRDSKITRLLEDSLGGNCITTMMAMVSPVIESFGESLSSLKFANRAKNIKNDPIINEDVDQRALLRKYEYELKRLRTELNDRSRQNLDSSSVSKLEEDRRRAERDKVAAVQALELRSQEFVKEREEKKKLEEKIRVLYSQVLQGGKKVEDTPQFRTAIEQHQKLIRQQYEMKLQDLEKERQTIEEDKAQVDRYKQLLLKQRDIMIALTTRLNERDETIVQLQEELDAYDRIHRETEEYLEINVNRVNQLQEIMKENNISIPQETRANPTNIPKAPLYNRVYAPYNAEIVRYGEQETYNVPQGNMLTAEEKISEMSQVAEDQRQEILRLKGQLEDVYNNTDTSEFLKNELSTMNEKNGKNENFNNFHQEIKYSLNNIIDSLSSQNEPEKLQNVARDLLNLQKLVGSMSPNRNENRPPQILGSKPGTPSHDMNNQNGFISGHRHAASMSKLQDEKSPTGNMRPTVRDQNRQNFGMENPAYSLESTASLENRQNFEKQSQDPYSSNRVKTRTLSEAPRDEKNNEKHQPVVMARNGNKKSDYSSGKSSNIYNESIGGLAQIEPNRKPMSVEEMLRLKKAAYQAQN